MTTTVFSVANHILSSSTKENKQFDLLQLIKLCYLSYGWYFAYHNKRLFEEKIEAWRYGPVIPELYYALKHFKGKKLRADCLKSLTVKDEKSSLSDDVTGLIRAVLVCYGDYTGEQLSALTHKENSPWFKTYVPDSSVRIPDEVIRQHFEQLKNEI